MLSYGKVMDDKQFKLLLESIQNIEKRLDKIEKTSTKMSNHINFVEKTYNILRLPLTWLKNKVEYTSSYQELPLLEDTKNVD